MQDELTHKQQPSLAKDKMSVRVKVQNLQFKEDQGFSNDSAEPEEVMKAV